MNMKESSAPRESSGGIRVAKNFFRLGMAIGAAVGALIGGLTGFFSAEEPKQPHPSSSKIQ